MATQPTPPRPTDCGSPCGRRGGPKVSAEWYNHGLEGPWGGGGVASCLCLRLRRSGRGWVGADATCTGAETRGRASLANGARSTQTIKVHRSARRCGGGSGRAPLFTVCVPQRCVEPPAHAVGGVQMPRGSMSGAGVVRGRVEGGDVRIHEGGGGGGWCGAPCRVGWSIWASAPPPPPKTKNSLLWGK